MKITDRAGKPGENRLTNNKENNDADKEIHQGTMSDSTKILESGLARCVTEPRGANGLEGYGLEQSYRFERCQDANGRYCRVYPGGSSLNYYETCGEVVFAGYFEPVEVRGASKK
jgi:hypothetical protein